MSFRTLLSPSPPTTLSILNTPRVPRNSPPNPRFPVSLVTQQYNKTHLHHQTLLHLITIQCPWTHRIYTIHTIQQCLRFASTRSTRQHRQGCHPSPIHPTWEAPNLRFPTIPHHLHFTPLQHIGCNRRHCWMVWIV